MGRGLCLLRSACTSVQAYSIAMVRPLISEDRRRGRGMRGDSKTMTKTGHVLLVEDDPAIRGLLSLTIEGEGFHVQSAGDGLEALDKVRHERPDVIVLDLVMPSMDGRTLIDA